VRKQYQPFRFLDLPPELRNIVYSQYLDDTQIIGNGNDTQQARLDKFKFHGVSGHLKDWESSSNGMYYMRCRLQKYQATEKRKRINIENLMVDKDNLSDIGYSAYIDYIEAHACFADRMEPCQHENHAQRNIVRISEHGNLCEDLPFLAQTCHLILGEMWPLCFSTRRCTVPKKDRLEKTQDSIEIEYHARVRNFDYFLLFRFLHMLRRDNKGIAVKGHVVHLVLEDQKPKADACGTKFEKVERLFAMHWLVDLPLWGCLTGLRKEYRFADKAQMPKHGYEPKGTGAKIIYWAWLQSMRQIVALYHIDRPAWREISIKYLDCWKVFLDDDTVRKTVWTTTIPEYIIVEAIIPFIGGAIKAQRGTSVNWRDNVSPRVDYFHVSESYNPQELGHGNAHLAGRYCLKVEEAIKKELGARLEEWEKTEDDKVVPLDMLS
jgi:hypothetical protein